MKLSKTLLTLAALAAVGFATSAQAIPITGQLNISGSAHYNAPIATATEVVSFTNVTTGDGNTGSFAGIPAMVPVTMTAPYFFAIPPGPTVPALWSVGGFTFDLMTSKVDFQTSAGIILSGTGIIMGPGFDPTEGTWSYSQQAGIGTVLTFSATTFAAVPDGGMSLTLLGAGLVGLAVIRAKFGKA